MDFSWSEEQLVYREKVVEFARAHLDDDIIERDRTGAFSKNHWTACAKFGIQSLSIPSAYNASGEDTDLLTAVLAMEAMGYACRDNGLTFALNTQMWTVQYPIFKFGTEGQKKKYLPAMCAGSLIGAHSLTEPDSGSDAFSLSATARPCPGGYQLDGTKSYVTLGSVADVVLIFATCDPGNGLTFALNTQMWTVQYPIFKFGTEGQKKKYLPAMCAGSLIGAHSLTEPDSGSDAFSLSATARPCPGGYQLDGTKSYVTLGSVADVVLIFATCDPGKGKWGITAFLVDAASTGFEVSPVQDKMGLRTVPMSDITLTDCFVPVENRLGPEGAGVSISSSCLELERCCILASQLGAMERQLEESISYAKTRRQFDQPIGKFQSVSNRIADMKLRLETARLLLYKVAWLRHHDRPAMLEAALLKLHLSESFVESGLDAIRTHGGAGYLTASGVERDLRDAIGGLLYAGTSDIQRVIVARLLGL